MGNMKFRRNITDCLRKPRDVLRKHKVKLYRKKPFWNALLEYLPTNSFMYGPLISTPRLFPGLWFLTGDEPEKRSNAYSTFNVLKEIFAKDVLSSKDDMLIDAEPIKRVIHRLEETGEIGGQGFVQGTYMKVSKTVTTTTVTEEDEQGDPKSGLSGTPQEEKELTPRSVNVGGGVEVTPRSVNVGGGVEVTETEGDEENSVGHEGHNGEEDFHDHIPLDPLVAEKVANQLIAGLGGRFSDDLGLNVDASNAEVECWFLAANFFSRSVSFDVSRNTYKKLAASGVSNTSDLLNLKESQLAAILEKTGFTKYGQRVASQLRKLANHLEDNNWGRISTFKHTSEHPELIRQLRNLPGVKLTTARIFLRELQGVWKGVTPEFDMKTKRAAVHLKLLGSIKISSNPEVVLREFSQEAGIDPRDLEVALYKLGTEHERDYSECPGGSDCKLLGLAEKLLASLPTNFLSDAQ